MPELYSYTGLRDVSIIGGRFFISSYIGMEEFFMHFSHSLLRKSSRLTCGEEIIATTGSQGRGVD